VAASNTNVGFGSLHALVPTHSATIDAHAKANSLGFRTRIERIAMHVSLAEPLRRRQLKKTFCLLL